ncbi:hypothetical protein BAUCODRAFT_29069 [Baudoinia panamericana UAMH 10762]|uniref:Uncharacterized protein n=1 Tax=Baudoinia panamericana (strain UAMH 10762) TaxID=717646 RepID=M2N965_BAUPA|nr:uncharacterized protein BAUCODRAFT_29069 [Baudoinia panamericana UAMH 10762]EMD00709.1 hypothetical protein BAUCODRAFT_29069 [Baudoinia panamericana UAMH 10762]
MWEKLCFVLACAIVVVLLAGTTKLGYTHWRLRKYVAVAEKEKKEQAIQRQMSQRRRHDETPFGIRALENGIEVEGVWVSRPNTPDSATRENSVGSLVLQQYQRRSGDLALHEQPPPIHTRDWSSSSSTSAGPPSSAFDRAVSAERLPSSNASIDSRYDGGPISRPAKTRYPPCSFTKYSNSPYAYRQSSSSHSTLEDMEAVQRASLEAIRRASTSIHEDRSNSDDSVQNENDTEPISAAAPKLLTHQPSSKPRNRSVDFEMMNSHRVSLAAETGQLAPRTRRPGRSGECTNVGLVTNPEQSDYSSQRSAALLSPVQSTSPTSPLSTPRVEALPPAVRRASMPDVTPFTQFCQSTPPSPQLERRRLTDLHSYTTTSAQYQGADTTVSLPSDIPAELPAAVPTMPARSPPISRALIVHPASMAPPPERTSFEKRGSQILRGHGTGFEILKPGSLNPTLPFHLLPANDGSHEKQHTAPPVSLHNAYRSSRSRSRSSSVGAAGRKLQKKRRASTDSTASNETHRSWLKGSNRGSLEVH